MSGAGSPRGFLRANRWPLLALVLLVPGAILAAMSVATFDYLAAHPAPQQVAAGRTGHLGDVAVRLTARHVIRADSAAGTEAGVAPGTELVAATIRVTGGAHTRSGTPCDAKLVQATPAGDRTWSTSYVAGYPASAGANAFCSVKRGATTTFQALFVVPAGTSARAELRFSASTSLSGSAQLTLH